MASVWFQNATIVRDGALSGNMTVLVRDGRIAYVGGAKEAPPCADARVIDADGAVLLRGFVNAHTHLAMTLLRGYGSDLPLQSWLERVWPIEDRMQPEDIFWGATLAICEMLRSGTTACLDMYMHMDAVARACADTGFRASLARAVMDAGGGGEKRLEEAAAFARAWHGAQNGRISVWMGPHAEYTCSSALLDKALSEAVKLGMKATVHVSETEGEVASCKARHGVSPVRFFQERGWFDLHCVAAHCVAVDEDDIAILAEKGVFVAHNPVSNLKLASGIMPYARMKDAGVRLCLGTDGAASNNRLDMQREMFVASLVHKGAQREPQLMPTCEALMLATESGAAALGEAMPGLAVGAKADLTLLDTRGLECSPQQNLWAHLVYSAPLPVKMTMVDGRVLYEDGTVLCADEARARFEVERIASRLYHGG